MDTQEEVAQFAFVVEITEYDKDTGFEALDLVSDKAERSLQTSLAKVLGFQVLSHEKGHFTAASMEELLLRFVSAVFPETTCCVLFILSGRGVEDKFFTSDGRAFTYDIVTECLGSNVSLQGKTKWLMFPVCRGLSDSTTQNIAASTSATAAELKWCTTLRTTIVSDTIRSFATPEAYVSCSRHNLDELTSLIQRLAANGQRTIELLELLRQLTKSGTQSSTSTDGFGRVLPPRMILRIGDEDMPLVPSQTKILEGEEAEQRMTQLVLKPENQFSLHERWLFRALAAGIVNRWAVTDVLQKEKEKQKQTSSGRK